LRSDDAGHDEHGEYGIQQPSGFASDALDMCSGMGTLNGTSFFGGTRRIADWCVQLRQQVAHRIVDGADGHVCRAMTLTPVQGRMLAALNVGFLPHGLFEKRPERDRIEEAFARMPDIALCATRPRKCESSRPSNASAATIRLSYS
jgi:hypothetical protein